MLWEEESASKQLFLSLLSLRAEACLLLFFKADRPFESAHSLTGKGADVSHLLLNRVPKLRTQRARNKRPQQDELLTHWNRDLGHCCFLGVYATRQEGISIPSH